ncbi:transcription antitermination factor NusB [Leptolyngbya sp. AN02str]|uniref:transcription antitermination factor NusB n=1 Tax=Leptolyngbya sp. AN02str TaxID=3423363 RepID=UPI003D32348F
MQARRIARELALLSLSQIKTGSERVDIQQLQEILLAAIRTLTTEAQDTLETAAAELDRGSDRLLKSETNAPDLQSAKTMVQDAINLTQAAINRLGNALEMPEFIHLANQKEVREYAMGLLQTALTHYQYVDDLLSQHMVDWQLHRLARIDQDILRIALTEIIFVNIPDKVAINEAVELAKKYSGEDGHRFINGVLRRVNDARNQAETPAL